jgi:hypothetical protein
LSLVRTPPVPPTPDAVASHAAKALFTADCVWQAEVVVVTGHVKVIGGSTVNVAWHVVVRGAQELVYVNVTVVEPPPAAGAPELLFVSTPLHPPLPDAVANHAAKAAFTAAWVWPLGVEVFTGHVNTTASGAVTVNVASHVLIVASQLLVKVNVTVVEPPHADGAPVLLFVSTPLTPLPEAVASHAVKALFTAVCVWQAAVVVVTGHVTLEVAIDMVKQLLIAVQGSSLNVLVVTLR